jgi:hypothetical protein
MNLKEARKQNKLHHFAKEKEKTHPKGSHLHFHGVIKSMAGGKSKPKKGTSK